MNCLNLKCSNDVLRAHSHPGVNGLLLSRTYEQLLDRTKNIKLTSPRSCLNKINSAFPLSDCEPGSNVIIHIFWRKTPKENFKFVFSRSFFLFEGKTKVVLYCRELTNGRLWETTAKEFGGQRRNTTRCWCSLKESPSGSAWPSRDELASRPTSWPYPAWCWDPLVYWCSLYLRRDLTDML